MQNCHLKLEKRARKRRKYNKPSIVRPLTEIYLVTFILCDYVYINICILLTCCIFINLL